MYAFNLTLMDKDKFDGQIKPGEIYPRVERVFEPDVSYNLNQSVGLSRRRKVVEGMGESSPRSLPIGDGSSGTSIYDSRGKVIDIGRDYSGELDLAA